MPRTPVALSWTTAPRRVAQRVCKPLELLKISEALFHGQPEVLSQERLVNVAFVRFDDRIGRKAFGLSGTHDARPCGKVPPG